MKKAEEEAYEDAKVHLGLTLRSATRVLEVLAGVRAVVEVQGNPRTDMTCSGQKPPYDEDAIAFIDDELKKVVSSAVAARVALGKASVFSKKQKRDA
jgi:hypothetical protein